MYKIDESKCRGTEEFPELSKNWYYMKGTKNFGTVSYLYKKYECPNNYQDFYNCYTADTIGDDVKTIGRTENYLQHQAELLSINSQQPLTTCFDFIIKKLFIDTLDGQKKEIEVKELLENKGYQVKEPTYIQDTQEGIDKLVYKDDKLFCLIQVKPLSFFCGNSKSDLINDRKLAVEKEKLCIEKYKVPVFYLIYNNRTKKWVTNNKGNKAHLLKTLINENGISY